MLYNTVELIIQASSNFHFIFCFCNLIIFFVLISEGSKPRPNRSVIQSTTVNPSSFRVDYNGVTSNASSSKGITNQDAENDLHFGDNSEEQRRLRADSTETGSVEIQIYEKVSPENEEVNSSSEEELTSPEGIGDDYDDGEEFNRKIDEFIAKVNKEWRKEKLRITDD